MGLLFFALCSIPAEGRRPGGKAAAANFVRWPAVPAGGLRPPSPLRSSIFYAIIIG